MSDINFQELPYLNEIKADIKNNTYQIFINNNLYFTGVYMQFFFSTSEQKYFFYNDRDSLLGEVKKIKKILIQNNKSYRFVFSEELQKIFFA